MNGATGMPPTFMPLRNTVGHMPMRLFTLQRTDALLIKFLWRSGLVRGVKIDARKQCASDRDYLMSVEDIKKWERKYGPIPVGAWVIMYTGIGTQFYPDPKRVLGTDKKGLTALPELSFPAFSRESAEFLTKERNIKGIAIDTPSIDYGKSKDFWVHRVICGADKLGLENVANLDKLPATGAMLYVIPMSIKGGTGAPARVFAILS
jgi:kynurenine formamidase